MWVYPDFSYRWDGEYLAADRLTDEDLRFMYENADIIISNEELYGKGKNNIWETSSRWGCEWNHRFGGDCLKTRMF